MKCPRCNGTGQIPTGKEMKALREAKGLTQKYVAEKMGIKSGYLSDLENDRRDWSARLEQAYLKALDEREFK